MREMLAILLIIQKPGIEGGMYGVDYNHDADEF